MRNVSILLLPLLILGGCNDNGSNLQPSPVVFRVDLQSQFFDDSLRVQVDGQMVFEGRATTDNILSLAKSISVNASSGRHHVHVEVADPNAGTDKDTTVMVKDTLTVAVNLDERSRMLYFNLYPFLIPYR